MTAPQDASESPEPLAGPSSGAAPGSAAGIMERTVDECLGWAETGDMNCGPRTEQSIKVLAAEVRRLRARLPPNEKAEARRK